MLSIVAQYDFHAPEAFAYTLHYVLHLICDHIISGAFLQLFPDCSFAFISIALLKLTISIINFTTNVLTIFLWRFIVENLFLLYKCILSCWKNTWLSFVICVWPLQSYMYIVKWHLLFYYSNCQVVKFALSLSGY